MSKIVAYHYNLRGDKPTKIALGETITSVQHSKRTYQKFYAIYKRVAEELGKYYPECFGYAYPEQREHLNNSNSICHIVEAPADKVTKGCFNHSIFHSMDYGCPLEFKGIRDLSRRIALWDGWIEEQARLYFTKENKNMELISDQFTVIGYK